MCNHAIVQGPMNARNSGLRGCVLHSNFISFYFFFFFYQRIGIIKFCSYCALQMCVAATQLAICSQSPPTGTLDTQTPTPGNRLLCCARPTISLLQLRQGSRRWAKATNTVCLLNMSMPAPPCSISARRHLFSGHTRKRRRTAVCGTLPESSP